MRAPVTTSVSETSDLATRYLSVRDRTEALASVLSPEDQALQSMPDVAPTKWHRAHSTWFFEHQIIGLSCQFDGCFIIGKHPVN